MEVQRGKPNVRGPMPGSAGLLMVEVPLEPRTDEAWASIFGGRTFFDAPPGVTIASGMHPPQLRGDSVLLTPPDTEIEKYVAHLDERIAATNAEYEKRVRPE